MSTNLDKIKILTAARQELLVLERVIHNFPESQIEDVFESYDSNSQKYISPIYLPDKLFVVNWQSQVYESKPFPEDYPEYYTNREERVRSKTEKIIADTLDRLNIPYHYEYPLKMSGLKTFYPDFLMLNIRLRKEIYLEHFGLLDDAEYRENALAKINVYQQNGIYPGENLIITHETTLHPINTKLLEKTLCHYLL